MENQHKKIAGYRDLSQEEINAMNGVKSLESQFNGMIDFLKTVLGIDQRQVALAATHGEDAFMHAVRAVAQPERQVSPFAPVELNNASTSGVDTIEVQAIPDDAELDAMDADALVSLALRHGYPATGGHGRGDAHIFLRVKRDGGTYTQPGNADLAGDVAVLPAIPNDEELGAMDDSDIYYLARAHYLPGGDDPSRENDIARLITKRDSTVAEGPKAEGPPQPAPPIDGDEDLEGANDGYIKTLALEHGLNYVDRADAIAKLKTRRDSIVSNHGGGQPNPV